MSATVAEPLTFDSRERAVLDYLYPALSAAVARNRPVRVDYVHTSLTQKELISLAGRLCRNEDANVAILASTAGNGLVFVPI